MFLGSSDADLIEREGVAGNDTLRGNAVMINYRWQRSDTYKFAIGDGPGTSINNPLELTSPAADTDVLSIEGIVPRDLWLVAENGDNRC